MSFPYTPNVHEEKMESLQTQYEFLNILRLRHLQWMNDAADPNTGLVHHEIVELIEQLTDHYNLLLAELQAKRDGVQGRGDGGQAKGNGLQGTGDGIQGIGDKG